MTVKILRLNGVRNLIGVSKSTLYAWIQNGTFPAPIQLGPRAVGWSQKSVEDWIESRQSARNGAEVA